MIIIGHPLIAYKPLFSVLKIEDIKKTDANSTILIDFTNEKVLKYVSEQGLSFALHVESLKDACVANALGARFLIVKDEKMAKKVQNIATEYLFDAKILQIIENEEEIEQVAQNCIDGVLFKNSTV